MKDIDLSTMTIKKAHEGMKNGHFSAVQLAEAYLKEISKKNKNINAFLEVYDDVLNQALKADEMIKSARAKENGENKIGKMSILTGIPFAIKDNILIQGKKASSASKILENYKAVYDATVISKLKKEGVVFIGRTNMDEFAMGGSTENSAFGTTKNPHDTTRVPGGSSGGSAAAVAAPMALGALGSDTGGSIRQPASFCGVVGLKPTYGAISRSGLMAMASSLDQIGPFTRTVADAEILFNVLKGNDPLDSTSAPDSVWSDKKIEKKKLRIGVPEDFAFGKGVDKDVVENFKKSMEALAQEGHEIVPIKLAHITHSLAVYYILMPAEASTNLARFDGVRFGALKEGATLFDDYAQTRGAGFAREVRRPIML